MKKIALAAMFLLWTSEAAFAQKYPKDLFAVSQLHFDSVRQPHGVDWYLNSKEAQAIIASIAGNMGIHPGYVKLAMNAVPRADPQGEETFYALPVERGYSYCAARIRITSIVPGSGDRASVVNANIGPSGELGIYTWTPIRHYGEGRSWVEGDAQVYGIKPEYLREFIDKGVCKEASAVTRIFNCEGNPCPGGEHGRPETTADQAPDLRNGWGN